MSAGIPLPNVLGRLWTAALLFFPPVPAAAATQAVPILHAAPGGDSAIVVGASQGSRWVGWEKAHRLIAAGRSFKFYDQRTAVGTSRVQKPMLSPASGSAYNVRLSTRSTAKTPLIGLAGATWTVVPRAPGKLDAGMPALAAAVAELLRTKGVASPRVEVAAAWEVDLDGDGTRETLIVAASPGYVKALTEGDGTSLPAGAFSGVFLRATMARKTVTRMVAGEVYPRGTGEGSPPQSFGLTQVADLNGDGAMEIVVHSHYYEGGGVTVVQWKGGKLRNVLSCADGA